MICRLCKDDHVPTYDGLCWVCHVGVEIAAWRSRRLADRINDDKAKRESEAPH